MTSQESIARWQLEIGDVGCLIDGSASSLCAVCLSVCLSINIVQSAGNITRVYSTRPDRPPTTCGVGELLACVGGGAV